VKLQQEQKQLQAVSDSLHGTHDSTLQHKDRLQLKHVLLDRSEHGFNPTALARQMILSGDLQKE
jgi:trehalose utilization protein